VGQSFGAIPVPEPPIIRKSASGAFYDKGLEGASHHAVSTNCGRCGLAVIVGVSGLIGTSRRFAKHAFATEPAARSATLLGSFASLIDRMGRGRFRCGAIGADRCRPVRRMQLSSRHHQLALAEADKLMVDPNVAELISWRYPPS
jgi:hypothetical protein